MVTYVRKGAAVAKDCVFVVTDAVGRGNVTAGYGSWVSLRFPGLWAHVGLGGYGYGGFRAGDTGASGGGSWSL